MAEKDSWPHQQTKIAPELITAELFSGNLKEAEGVVYDGALVYTWWDDFIDMNGTKKQKREAMAYRIAERIVLGEIAFQHAAPTLQEEKLIKELKQEILVACPSL